MTRRARLRGYTAVELMMSLAVFAAGVTGIITMQRAAIGGNRLAKNVTIANGIAQAWQAQLAADATLWTADLTGTTWLKSVNTSGMNGVWQRLTWDENRNFGPEFDALGKPIESGGDFCTHVRLTWLFPDGTGALGGLRGNGVLRTEVRVFWPREGATRVEGDCANADSDTITAIETPPSAYHFVVQAGAVRQP